MPAGTSMRGGRGPANTAVSVPTRKKHKRTARRRAPDVPTREAKKKVRPRSPPPFRASLHWGDEHLWANPPYDPADPHNPMLDSKGRVWMGSKIRGGNKEGGGGDRHK